MLDLRGRKFYGFRVAVGSEAVDDRASGISQAEKLGDFVEGFAGGVVAGVADVFVGPGVVVLGGEIEMGVAAGDDQGEHGKLQLVVALLPFFQQHGVNVAFEMVDGDQRLVEGEGQSFGVADADEQVLRRVRGLG